LEGFGYRQRNNDNFSFVLVQEQPVHPGRNPALDQRDAS